MTKAATKAAPKKATAKKPTAKRTVSKAKSPAKAPTKSRSRKKAPVEIVTPVGGPLQVSPEYYIEQCAKAHRKSVAHQGFALQFAWEAGKAARELSNMGLSQRKIAEQVGVSQSRIRDYLKVFASAETPANLPENGSIASVIGDDREARRKELTPIQMPAPELAPTQPAEVPFELTPAPVEEEPVQAPAPKQRELAPTQPEERDDVHPAVRKAVDVISEVLLTKNDADLALAVLNSLKEMVTD